MYLWRYVLLLSAMAAPGDCMKCKTCTAYFSDSCEISSIENCPEGQVCASQLMVTAGDESADQTFNRLCAPKSECNVIGTFTLYETPNTIATTCCFNDLCTPEKPKVPAVNSKEPNGLMCPLCETPSDFCDPNQKINCTGKETMCVRVSTASTLGEETELIVAAGCASNGYCLKNNMTSTENQLHINTTYTCTKGTRSDEISSNTSTGHTMAPLTAAFLYLWLLLFIFC